MRRTAYGVATAALLLAGCQSIHEELPTQATKPSSTGMKTIAIPTILGNASTPAPAPTPTPAATPAPTPAPTPTPSTGRCGAPVPAPVSRMNVKIHIRGANRYILDSTPLVGPDAAYCAEIGFTDGRLWCPVRPEGAPDREACEEYVMGFAKDSKRQGPTWYLNGELCTATKCENHEDNQYLLYAYAGGRYEACAKNDVCGAVDVGR
jgi:hypothetical protein